MLLLVLLRLKVVVLLHVVLLVLLLLLDGEVGRHARRGAQVLLRKVDGLRLAGRVRVRALHRRSRLLPKTAIRFQE